MVPFAILKFQGVSTSREDALADLKKASHEEWGWHMLTCRWNFPHEIKLRPYQACVG